MTKQIEQRLSRHSKSRLELRMEGDEPKYFEGYAVVYYREDDPGTQYWLWEDLVERIMPGAGNRAVNEKDDARATFNHDPGCLLGRVASGTCEITSDAVGLRYRVPFDPNDPDHVRTAAKIKRGDLVGSSFGFRATKTAWREVEIDQKLIDIREIEEFELFDVGPVVDPAYGATTAGFRSAVIGADEERKRLLTERGEKPEVVSDVDLDWEEIGS